MDEGEGTVAAWNISSSPIRGSLMVEPQKAWVETSWNMVLGNQAFTINSNGTYCGSTLKHLSFRAKVSHQFVPQMFNIYANTPHIVLTPASWGSQQGNIVTGLQKSWYFLSLEGLEISAIVKAWSLEKAEWLKALISPQYIHLEDWQASVICMILGNTFLREV